MTFRGVYRDGIIVPSADPDLPNGTVVRWTSDSRAKQSSRAVGRSKSRSNARPAGKKMTKAQRIAAVMQAFGMDRDRPDWKGRSSAEIAADLRRRALGGRFRG
jgi:hypothetical protein